MILNKQKNGRSLKDLLSFRQSVTVDLYGYESSYIWIDHISCLESDFNYFVLKINRYISKTGQAIATTKNELKAKAAFLNYIEILYFGRDISFANIIYTFTKPDSIYTELEKDVMMEFTSSFYRDMCYNNKILSILLIASIMKWLKEQKAFDNNDNNNTVPERKDNRVDQAKIDKIEQENPDMNDIGFFVEMNQIQTKMPIVHASSNDIIKMIKQDFQEIKDFYESVSAGDEKSEHDFNDTIDLMDAIDIKSFNTKQFKSFATHIRKWGKSKKQGYSITNHIAPLLDTDDFLEILNLEILQYPAFYEDLMVKTTRSTLEYDLYVDVSGSTIGNIINLEKRAYIEFFKNKEIRERYVFDIEINQMDHYNLLRINGSGGTRINLVIEQINARRFPSIIITDAEDTIDTYSKYAMFMIFGHYNKDSFVKEAKKYVNNKQVMFYDNHQKVFRFPS